MPSYSVTTTEAEAQSYSTSIARAWGVVIIAALFFFYEFIQMNMFNTINLALREAFHLTAQQMGVMSSFYFIANVVFLVVAGSLLDRYSTRKVILVSLAVCILGTALFAYSTSFGWACVFRFMTGIGSAFCFLSVIRLASRWFKTDRMALVIGVVVTIAMIGGMVAQTPMAMLVEAVQWRHALLIDAAVGIFVWLLIASLVRDYPKGQVAVHVRETQAIRELGQWRSMTRAFLNVRNWCAGLYGCFMNLPLGLLGGLWGSTYLTTVHHLDSISATSVSMMMFVGMIVGSPLAGWISDRIKRRRLPMLVGAVLAFVLMSMILYLPHWNFEGLLIAFFGLGLIIGTQIISYPLVAENSARILTAMSVSVVNISVQGGIGIFQSVFGRLLDTAAITRLHHTTLHFTASDFHFAMQLFPIGFVIAFVMACCVRETYCKQRASD